MASIKLNGDLIHLKSQPLAEFQSLTRVAYGRLKPDEPILQTIGTILFEALVKPLDIDSSVVQTLLSALHDLGVEEMRVSIDEKRMDFDKVTPTDSLRGSARAFGVAAIESGRVFVAALANVQGRAIRINGKIVPASPQPKEAVEKVIKQIQGNRLVNEDLIFTSCRALGAFMKAGKGAEDPDYRAAVEIAAGLGVADLVIDFDAGKLAVRGFSEHNAAAMALLQGGTAKQVQSVRERVQKLTEKLAEALKTAADNAPVTPAPAQRLAIPSMIGSRRGQRRRT